MKARYFKGTDGTPVFDVSAATEAQFKDIHGMIKVIDPPGGLSYGRYDAASGTVVKYGTLAEEKQRLMEFLSTLELPTEKVAAATAYIEALNSVVGAPLPNQFIEIIRYI